MRIRAYLSERRGQTAPLGFALVLAVMVTTTTVVVAVGAGGITDTQSQIEAERVQKAMTELDSQTALVALGESSVQSISLSSPGGEGYTVDDSSGHVAIKHVRDATTTTLVDTDLGEVRKAGTETTIAYQGGGVWRKRDNGSVMISPPEFHYRNATLTFPIVTVDGSETLDGDASVSKSSSNQLDVTNPIEDGTIVVVITSAYYHGWGQYFETRTDGAVSYDHANDEVTIELVTPIKNTEVTSAVAGLSSGDLQTQGNGGEPAPCTSPPGPPDKFYTDSYNSSKSGDYCTQWLAGRTNKNGNVTFGGDVDYGGNANFYGNIRSGGSVDITGNADIDGEIFWTDSFSPSGAASYDDDTMISGVPSQTRINTIIGETGRAIADDNDNDDANDDAGYDAITSGPDPAVNFAGEGPTVEIDQAGEYHLERIDVGSSQTLTLDTDDGDITIAVDEYVNVDGTIEVDGNNRVEIYVRTMGGSGTVSTGWRDAGLKVHGGTVVVPGNDAPQLRVFGNDTLNASVEGGQFTGIVWAPVGAGGPGGFRVRQGDVYGGVVTGDVSMENKGRIHYDEALANEQVISQSASVAKITYVHISTNTVVFTD